MEDAGLTWKGLHTRMPGESMPRRETNPIICPGEPCRPSGARFWTYNAGAAIGHAAVARMLPGRWRTAWPVVWIGVEAGYAHQWYRIGVRF